MRSGDDSDYTDRLAVTRDTFPDLYPDISACPAFSLCHSAHAVTCSAANNFLAGQRTNTECSLEHRLAIYIVLASCVRRDGIPYKNRNRSEFLEFRQRHPRACERDIVPAERT